jgi:hypothetical protein
MRNPELAQLRQLVARQEQGWRLRPGSRDGLYNLSDSTGLIAEDLTSAEVRGVCFGTTSLGQVRQQAR